MRDVVWIYSIPSLLYGLLYLAALILSFVFWRRHPKVCLLVFIGSLLNLVTIAGRYLLPFVWFQGFEDRHGFMFANVGMSLVSLCGSALLLAAIFTGRSDMPRHPYWPRRGDEALTDARREDEDWRRPPAPPSRPEPGSTGIQEH